MTIRRLAAAALISAIMVPCAGIAQPPAPVSAMSYSDLADLAVAAPIVVQADVREAIRMKDAPVPAGEARFYVEADVRALIRSPGGSPPRINYIADVPLDSRGKPPKLKKMRVLLLARPVPGKPASIQLVAPDAQIAWSQPVEARLRAILTELTRPGAPPRITGVRSAFHVPGAIQGEGETQIFLQTDTGNPVSISVLRRPGQIAQWAVALGEIVDEAAGPPRPESLLWYRLACGLPRELPERAIDPGDPANADKARADYRVVVDGLGACGRTRPAQRPR